MTGGNTGVGLALVAAAKGYNAVMAMPSTIAREKIDGMRLLGARVVVRDQLRIVDEVVVVAEAASRYYYQTR